MRIETLADGVVLYLGDCAEVLPTLPRHDAVVTDPPYGIGETEPGVAMSRGHRAFPRDYGSENWQNLTGVIG